MENTDNLKTVKYLKLAAFSFNDTFQTASNELFKLMRNVDEYLFENNLYTDLELAITSEQ